MSVSEICNMSVFEIRNCDLKKRETTSVGDNIPVVGKVSCEDSSTGEAILEADSTGNVLICNNHDCVYNRVQREKEKLDP